MPDEVAIAVATELLATSLPTCSTARWTPCAAPVIRWIFVEALKLEMLQCSACSGAIIIIAYENIRYSVHLIVNMCYHLLLLISTASHLELVIILLPLLVFSHYMNYILL